MTISIWQAALLSLLCYVGALTTPWAIGTTGGWYIITRPLVAGFLTGLILGDVGTGIAIGIAVQVVYIGLITPGGAVPADLSFVSYLGIPLAMAAKASPDVAVSLSVGFGVIGVAAWQVLSVGNAGWAHLGDRYAEEGDIQGIIRINYLAQLGTFVLRGILPFFILYFGQGLAQDMISFLNTQVPWLVQYLGILGGALPAVGIAILLLQIAPTGRLILWFLLGWAIAGYLAFPAPLDSAKVVGVAAFGVMIALIYYWYFARVDIETTEARNA